jgi:hypothetical protein
VTQVLSASDVLSVWERGYRLGVVDRALLLLASARPDLPPGSLAHLPIGLRDLELCELRRATFGHGAAAVVTCPECASLQELIFDLGAMVAALGHPGAEKTGDRQSPDLDSREGVLSIAASGYTVWFRLPTSADVEAVALAMAGSSDRGPEAAQRLLVERLVLEVVPASGQSTELAPEVAAEVGEAMLDADPAAEVRLDVCCSGCGARWEALFDIASFLWREVDALARRLAVEVHVLASAYGWRESDILSLSAWRRQLYLDLVSL